MTTRNETVGASEVAALFGCSPWESAYSLWCKKTGLAQEDESNERLRVGQFLEKAILEEWNKRRGFFFMHNTESMFSPRYPDQSATPDAIERGADAISRDADIKTVEPTRRGDWIGGVPVYYRLQKQAQNMITGASGGFVVALFGFNELSDEYIEADPEIQAEIEKRCIEFMRRVRGELPPPEIDGHVATGTALKNRKHGEATIALGGDVYDWSTRLKDLEASQKGFDPEIRELRNKIRAALGSANRGLFGDGSGWQLIDVAESTSTRKGHTQMRRINNKDAE